MLPPDELMVEVFLPALRQLVSRRLSRDGYSQSAISRMLGVSQAAVSLYLASPDEKAYGMLSELSVQRDDADRYASLLAEDIKRNTTYSVETLHSIWTGLIGSGMACQAHRERYPSLADCDVCIREYRSREGGGRREAVEQVERAVGILERSREFVLLMPQVSVNIAYATPGASSVDDVVAVPGRIVRVKGAAKAFLKPEFGASRHLASILLLVRRRVPGHAAVVNIKHDSLVESVMKRLGISYIEVGGRYPGGSQDPVLEAIRESLMRAGASFDAVIDRGGEGTEPNVYLFGKDALSVAELAVRIAKEYSSRSLPSSSAGRSSPSRP
jgi:predicted fused transcriptional regulator/phosphomethylpyrimidine kinase/predicted transcriptional regulator